MEVTRIKRKFLYNGKELEDIQGLSPDAVVEHYSNVYPEMVNAIVTGPEIKEDEAVFTITNKTGTKG